LIDRLRLVRSQGIGPVTCRQLIARFVNAAAALQLSGISRSEEALGLVEELLGPSPIPVDEIIRLSGAPSGSVQMASLELDLARRLDRHASNGVSLR
jgi:DNA processing protein